MGSRAILVPCKVRGLNIVFFRDRVDASLRALFMAPVSHFTGTEFPDGRNTDRCYPGSGLVCKMTPCGAAITAMENKLKIEPRGQLGERLRRIQHRIENGPAPVHLVVDSDGAYMKTKPERYFWLGAEG